MHVSHHLNIQAGLFDVPLVMSCFHMVLEGNLTLNEAHVWCQSLPFVAHGVHRSGPLTKAPNSSALWQLFLRDAHRNRTWCREAWCTWLS